MKKRGRKTAGSLAAVEAVLKRPDPPEDLNERETEIWLEVTSGLPVDWIKPETFRLLKAYCSHIDRYERISWIIDAQLEKMDSNDVGKWVKAAEIESRAAVSLATKMRLTQQSTVRAEKKKPAGPAPAPWPMLNK